LVDAANSDVFASTLDSRGIGALSALVVAFLGEFDFAVVAQASRRTGLPRAPSQNSTHLNTEGRPFDNTSQRNDAAILALTTLLVRLSPAS
jgi:hypothetical protein